MNMKQLRSLTRNANKANEGGRQVTVRQHLKKIMGLLVGDHSPKVRKLLSKI